MTFIDHLSHEAVAEPSVADHSGRNDTASDSPAVRPHLDMGSRPPSELVDDKTASTYLGVTAGTLSVWRSTGRYPLPFVKVGRRVRYRIGDLLAFTESRTHLHTGSLKAINIT